MECLTQLQECMWCYSSQIISYFVPTTFTHGHTCTQLGKKHVILYLIIIYLISYTTAETWEQRTLKLTPPASPHMHTVLRSLLSSTCIDSVPQAQRLSVSLHQLVFTSTPLPLLPTSTSQHTQTPNSRHSANGSHNSVYSCVCKCKLVFLSGHVLRARIIAANMSHSVFIGKVLQ